MEVYKLRSSGRKTLSSLKKEAKHLPITLQVGKSGLSQGTIQELIKQIKSRKLVKVKLLRSALSVDKDVIIHALVNQSSAVLVEKIGLIIVLAHSSIVKYK